MRSLHGKRLTWCHCQEIEREAIDEGRMRFMVEILKCSFKANIAKVVFLDFILSIEGPHMIVVVVIPLKEKLKIEVPNLLVVLRKKLLHGSTRIALQIPQRAVEIEEKMFVGFQKDSPIFFIPNASVDKATLHKKNAIIILGSALGLCR